MRQIERVLATKVEKVLGVRLVWPDVQSIDQGFRAREYSAFSE